MENGTKHLPQMVISFTAAPFLMMRTTPNKKGSSLLLTGITKTIHQDIVQVTCFRHLMIGYCSETLSSQAKKQI